jgi:DNA-binding response OmpR family regulator
MLTTVWRLTKPGDSPVGLQEESDSTRTFDSMSDLVAAMQSTQTLPTWILLSPKISTLRSTPESLRYKELCFDIDRLTIEIPAEEKSCLLSFKEAQILKKLLSAAGSCVPRSELYTLLWGTLKVSSRTLDSHISRLRTKLEGSRIEIINVYGDGYLLR